MSGAPPEPVAGGPVSETAPDMRPVVTVDVPGACAVGRPVLATIRVEPRGPTQVERLVAWLWWMAEGGDDDLDHVQRPVEVELLAGTTIDAPRTFEVPLLAHEGPPSWKGPTVQIRWVVSARLTVDGETKGTHLPIDMAAAPTAWSDGEGYARQVTRAKRREQGDRDVRLYGRLAGFVVLLAFVGLLAVPMAIEVVDNGKPQGLLCIGAFVAVALAGLFRPLRSTVAELRARLAQKDARVTVPVGGAFELEGVRGDEARLVRVEEAARMERPKRRGATERVKVWRRSEHTVSRANARGGRATLRVPEDAPPTFETDTRRVYWEARVGDDVALAVIVLPWRAATG